MVQSCVKKDDSEWVKKCMDLVVENVRPGGRLKKDNMEGRS